MTDSLILVNVGSVIASFRIFRPITCDTNLPRHKLRKVVRNANVDVQILPGQTKDLVPLTELSSATLLTLPEVQSILRSPHIQLLSDLTVPVVAAPPSVLMEGKPDEGQASPDLDVEVVVIPAPQPVVEEAPVVEEEVQAEPTAAEVIQDAIEAMTPPEPTVELPSLSLDGDDNSMSKKNKNSKRLFK